MTEHTFEYPADFEPEKHCSQFAMTDSRCCSHSPNQRDCEVIKGYHKRREENRDPNRPWSFGDAIATCVVVSLVSFAVLWRVLG